MISRFKGRGWARRIWASREEDVGIGTVVGGIWSGICADVDERHGVDLTVVGGRGKEYVNRTR